MNLHALLHDPLRLCGAFFKDRMGKPLRLYPYQASLVSSILFKRHRFLHVQQCTQSGKTEALSIAACLCALLRSRERIQIIAPTLRQAQEVFSRCKSHLLYDSPLLASRVRTEPLTQSQLHVTHDALNPSTDSTIACLPASIPSGGETILGLFGTLNFLDESGSIPDPIYYEKLLRMGAALSSKSLLVESGTPHRRNHFYESSRDARYLHFHVDVDEALTAGAIDPEYFEFIRSRLHPQLLRSWYYAQFPEDEDRFFPTALLEPLIVSEEQTAPHPHHSYALGLDFAKSLDASVFVLGEIIGDTIWERKILSFHHVRYEEQMQALSELCTIFRPALAFGDSGGPGSPLLEQVERMTVHRVVPVSFTSQKTALYTNFHLLLSQGRYKLLNDLDALTEVLHLEHVWTGTNTSRLSIAAPTAMVEGRVLHDDHPDAKALLAAALLPSLSKSKPSPSRWFSPMVY